MKLVIEQGQFAGQEFLLDRALTVIGRGQQCDIVLQEPMASRQHAQITRDAQGWWLTDLGSTNGTQIDGRSIPAHRAQPLQPGSSVTIGNSGLVLRQRPSSAAAPVGSKGRKGNRHALLIGGTVLLIIVIGVLAILLVLAFRPEGEGIQTATIEAPEGGGTRQALPTALEELMTSVPVPSELEAIRTALPIPTDMEGLTTVMPAPTDLLDLMTSMPSMPGLPLGGTPTP